MAPKCLMYCSKTLVHPAPRKVLESIGDQENTPVTSEGKTAVVESDTASDTMERNTVVGKRLSTASINNAPAKKSKVTKAAHKPKIISLQKGQKKLSAFFRM